MLRSAEFMLAEREAELLESERVIVALQATKESLQNTLKDSMKATDNGHLARLAFEEEIALLRERSGVIQDSLESLEEDKLLRKQNEYKAKSSLLRSFRWKKKEVDPVVLQGAVAFWAATGEKDCTASSCRTSKETRKTILKAIIKDGFGGELQEELAKDAVKKKRFKIFDLARLSDLESKFNSEALGSIAHCETGF